MSFFILLKFKIDEFGVCFKIDFVWLRVFFNVGNKLISQYLGIG